MHIPHLRSGTGQQSWNTSTPASAACPQLRPPSLAPPASPSAEGLTRNAHELPPAADASRHSRTPLRPRPAAARSPAAGSSRTRRTHPPRELKESTTAAAGPTAAAAAPRPARRCRGAARLAVTCAALPPPPAALDAGPPAAWLVQRGGCRRSGWPSAGPGRAPTAGRCRSCRPPPSDSPTGSKTHAQSESNKNIPPVRTEKSKLSSSQLSSQESENQSGPSFQERSRVLARRVGE